MMAAIRRGAAIALIWPIKAYRIVLSPLLGQNCRFEPSCSRYAIEALEVHGPVKGLWLGIRRILRCHPITWLGGGSGFDPVPHPVHKKRLSGGEG